nr:diguanylate cyclase [Spirochaeta isovalerica]
MLSRDLLIVNSTAAYISVNPDISEEEFIRFASKIFGDSKTLSNLAAAPDLVLSYVYPKTGNEAIIGVDYRDLPDQLPLVLKARDSSELVVAGPIDILQGGQGILGRAPVFYEDNGSGIFWGIVSSLISLDSLINELKPLLDQNELNLSMRGINGTGSSGSVFYGDSRIFEEEDSIKSMVLFPNGSWQIAITPIHGFSNNHPYHNLIIFLIIIAVAVATTLNYLRMMYNQQLRENEKRLKDIINASSDIIWETDRSGIITYISGNGESNLGYTEDELLGSSIFSYTSKDREDKAVNSLRDLMEKGKPIVDMETRLKTRDGMLISILRNAIPVLENKSGKLVGYRGVDKDETMRKKLQEELEESEYLLSLFFKQSLDGFFFMMLDEPIEWNDSIDKESALDYIFQHQRITKINKAMLKQYHATETDFMGLTPSDFYKHDIIAGRKLWKRLFDEGRIHIDTDERRLDGSAFVVEGDYIVLWDSQGRITGHFGVQRDITSERDRDFQLKRYVAINDKYVIVSQTDLDGIITYASDAFCQICGYEREELIGVGHNIIRHPDMPDTLFKDLWETITSGRAWSGEMKNKRKDGTFYWVNTDVTPLENRMGEIYGYMAVRRNITAQKELEVISVTDKLTGLFNRQKVDRSLEEQQIRLSRYQEIYSIIILDIDHFKSINDNYGHLEGDRVLTSISRLIEDQIRQSDIPGRWGGEEFLIICPHTDLNGAAKLAEELRQTIEKFNFGLNHPVTISLGVAQATADNFPEVSDKWTNRESRKNKPGDFHINSITKKLINSADNALYKAKKQGRNQVVCGE